MAITYPGIEYKGWRYMVEHYGSDECFLWAERVSDGDQHDLRIRTGAITQEVLEAAVELGFPSTLGGGRWDAEALVAHYREKVQRGDLTPE